MNDTSPRMEAWLGDLYRKKRPDERMAMASSLFDTAKEIVRSSILVESPAISSRQLREKMFLRFYKDDFSPATLQKILRWL